MDADHETERLRSLVSLAVLDSPPERAYDYITRTAAILCSVPIALISIVDEKRQWFKSKIGIDVPETTRELSFCAHAIQRADEVMVVTDALQDERFRDHIYVTGDPKIRFYAGAPIVVSGGYAMGTVCVVDRVPRQLPEYQIRLLRHLSGEVAKLLEMRRMH